MTSPCTVWPCPSPCLPSPAPSVPSPLPFLGSIPVLAKGLPTSGRSLRRECSSLLPLPPLVHLFICILWSSASLNPKLGNSPLYAPFLALTQTGFSTKTTLHEGGTGVDFVLNTVSSAPSTAPCYWHSNICWKNKWMIEVLARLQFESWAQLRVI